MPMIDWVTALVTCEHPRPINGGRVVKVDQDGEVEWQTETRLQVAGSHESSLQVRTEHAFNGMGVAIRLHGNLTKWSQGHNLFGTDDLVGLVAITMERLTPILGLTPSDQDRASWHRGAYTLSRVDITESYELRNRADVRAWIRSAEHSAHLRHRGKGQLTKNGTLYFGKHSRRWSLKCYSKGDEIEAPGHTLATSLDDPRLAQWADNKLRIEVVMRGLELKRRGLVVAANWADNTCKVLHQELLQGLDMNDSHTLPPEKLEGLPPRLVAVYHLWKEGHDLRAMYPARTFYRYRSQLLSLGIDIAIRQPHEDRTNVVPLVRVLEAVPAGVPDWARGTPLYFEPRKRA